MVYAGTVMISLRSSRETDSPLFENHMVVGRRHVDMALLDGFTVFWMGRRKRSKPAENCRQQPLPGWRDMQHDEDGSRKIFGEAIEQGLQGRYPACRTSDNYDVVTRWLLIWLYIHLFVSAPRCSPSLFWVRRSRSPGERRYCAGQRCAGVHVCPGRPYLASGPCTGRRHPLAADTPGSVRLSPRAPPLPA